jgi:PAS domain S-box-containing protein
MAGALQRTSLPGAHGEMRATGIPAVPAMPWGTHICHFYESQSDLLEILVPYFRAGVEDNELCLWLTSDDHDAARRELVAAAPDAERRLLAGDIEIVAEAEWYLEEGRFDAGRVVGAWNGKLADVLARGYEGMRVHAGQGWLTQETQDAFKLYEERLNDALAGNRLLVLCAYALKGTSGSEIFDVARTHDFALAKRGGRWEMLETVELVAAKAEVERLNAKLEERVRTRTRELAEANAALRRSQELYRVLAENTTDLITLHDLAGRRVYASPSATRVLGELPDDPFAGVHPADRPALQQSWELTSQGERTFATYRHVHADGSWRWMEASGSLVQYQGRPHILAASRDVTDRMELEEQFRHAQKMEAVGRLAGGVAHDFNNLLTAILGYSELVLDELPADTPFADDVREIRLAGERARGVTRQLLAFSRPQVLDLRVVDVGTVVRGIERMLRLLLREDIHLEIRTSPQPLRVQVDPVQLEQVLMNLAVNARDATGPGGRIVVECGYVDAAAPDSGLPPYVRPGAYSRIVVSDTGAGLTPEVASHVFEPFFTTKPSGLGTGLGLSTVYGIAKQGGGYVWVESEPGNGAAFTVLLPITLDPEDRAAEAVAPGRHELQGRTAVLVEDEAAVRQFVAGVLRRRGMEVLAFATPDEALRVLADPGQPVDVLITDVVLPGISGPEMVERVPAGRDPLPVVYMSGYTAEEAAYTDLLRRSGVLAKPFGAEDLLTRVSAAIRPPPDGPS